MFVISADIYGQNWYRMKQFVIDVIRGIKIRADQPHIGIVSFSTTTVVNLMQYYDEDVIAKKIWELPYMNGVFSAADSLLVSAAVRVVMSTYYLIFD